MKFLVIGLGSMGKRRIRCLKALKHEDIVGFDLKEERRKEAETKYKVNTTNKLTSNILNEIDAIIISTPPDKHAGYIKIAVDNRKPVFIEASVISKGLEELNNSAKKNNVLVVPSCTMKFHPAIKEITDIVVIKKYGKVTNFSYHSGQYLPDWHPWENIKNYYVSKKETGGAREIVPFEL